MEQELYELIESALSLETKNKCILEDNFMTIYLPNGKHVILEIKECSNFAPSNHYTTNKVERKIGYEKNNPHYKKVMLKDIKDLQYYILDALNTMLNYAIKFVFIEKSPTQLELYYSI